MWHLKNRIMVRKRKQHSEVASVRDGFWLRQEAQSLIEVALMVPIFTVLICYAVDFGYFFLVAASLNSGARNAMEYAIQGTSSPAQTTEPSPTNVSAVAIAGIGLGGATTSTVSVRVCSSAVGVTMPANIASCVTPSTGAGAVTDMPDIDPEFTAGSTHPFQLNRIDVAYTVTPPVPIPAAIFPTLTFHRMVEMRAIR